jgi:hypothetical protein
MRTTDERVSAVKQRIKELISQKEQRKRNYFALSTAACLLIIILSISFAMPSIVKDLSEWDYSNNGMMASIFYEGSTLGYILIGLLSFALGACLTVLCFRLRHRDKQDKEGLDDDRNN